MFALRGFSSLSLIAPELSMASEYVSVSISNELI